MSYLYLAPEIILMIKIQPPSTRMCDESPWRYTKQKWFENLLEIIPMLNSHLFKSNYAGCIYLQLFVGGIMSYLHYLWSLVNSGVQHIMCFVFVFLRLVYPMQPVSMDCPFLLVLRYCLTFVYSILFYWFQTLRFWCTLTTNNRTDNYLGFILRSICNPIVQCQKLLFFFHRIVMWLDTFKIE
jgi:hypothetical protein